MKKFIYSLLIAVVLITPSFVGAETTQSLQGLSVEQLMQIIQSLQTQLQALKNNQTNTNCSAVFNRDLTVGGVGADVLKLHRTLNQEGFYDKYSASDNVKAEGSTNGDLFTEDTAAAVVKFQAKYGIRQTGYVGPITRAKLNNLYHCVASVLPIVTSNNSDTTCKLTSDKTSYKLGDTITYSWTSQNATYTSFQQDTSGKDHLWLPSDKLSANGSQQVTASVVGNPSVTLSASNGNTSGLCSTVVNISNLPSASSGSSNVVVYGVTLPTDSRGRAIISDSSSVPVGTAFSLSGNKSVYVYSGATNNVNVTLGSTVGQTIALKINSWAGDETVNVAVGQSVLSKSGYTVTYLGFTDNTTANLVLTSVKSQ